MDANGWLSELTEHYPVSIKKRKDSHLLCLGIPYRVLQDTAKKIYASDYQTFINSNPHEVYEMDIIQTKVIGLIKNFDEAKTSFDRFIPYAKEWSLVDSLCQNFKIAKKYPEIIFQRLETLAKSDDPYEQRIVAVMILSYFANEKYVKRSINLLLRLKIDHYYTKMAVAWAFQVIAVNYKAEVISVFSAFELNPWIQNKAIQKIDESFRISDETKQIFKTLRIN